MNFVEFQTLKNQLLNSNTIDLTETRVERGFSAWKPQWSPDELPVRSYRCHLAEFWLDAMNMPRSNRPRALICQGVRHALSVLFDYYASQNKQALLPRDVYPVYENIANTAGLTYEQFDTFPRLEYLPDADILLICNPAKPRSTHFGHSEIREIISWLECDSSRRVLIDSVYTYENSFDQFTQTLVETGQAIILHSLSKGWLHQQIMGVCFVPEQDVDMFTPIFRSLSWSGDQEGFRVAEYLLTKFSNLPQSLVKPMHRANERVGSLLDRHSIKYYKQSTNSYLLIVEGNWREILSQHDILLLPFSVFGANNDQCSVASVLNFIK